MNTSEQNPLIGRRIKLVRCTDQYTLLRPGALGTIASIDAIGTVHVNWDSGSRLGLCEDAGDRWELLLPGEEKK